MDQVTHPIFGLGCHSWKRPPTPHAEDGTEIDRDIIWPKGAKEETQISLDSNQCSGRGSVDGRGQFAEGEKRIDVPSPQSRFR